jgi:hypothetical protein
VIELSTTRAHLPAIGARKRRHPPSTQLRVANTGLPCKERWSANT